MTNKNPLSKRPRGRSVSVRTWKIALEVYKGTLEKGRIADAFGTTRQHVDEIARSMCDAGWLIRKKS